MRELLVVRPLPIAALTASRGDDAGYLLSHDPKEVWADTAVGSAATFSVDLGQVRNIDTIFLGHLRPPAQTASWTITGGIADTATSIQAATPLRVPDAAGDFPETSHALWHGSAITARYLSISVSQPAGAAPLTAGVLLVGRAFVAELGQEWGAGRQIIDTGTATSLPSGGFAVVEGARKLSFKWTFGDLSEDEADQLELSGIALGTTMPGLVVENADPTPGLLRRIRYGLFKVWQPFERRNKRQTRWEVAIEDWGAAPAPRPTLIPTATPSPPPTVQSRPSIASDGTPQVGETLTGQSGAYANGSVSGRAWLRGTTVLSSAAAYTPTSVGSLVFREFITGGGATIQADSDQVTVAAATVTPTPTPTPTPSQITIDQFVTRSGNTYTFTARRTTNLSSAESRTINIAGSTSYAPAATAADFGGAFPVLTANFAAGANTAQFQVTSPVAQPE